MILSFFPLSWPGLKDKTLHLWWHIKNKAKPHAGQLLNPHYFFQLLVGWHGDHCVVKLLFTIDKPGYFYGMGKVKSPDFR